MCKTETCSVNKEKTDTYYQVNKKKRTAHYQANKEKISEYYQRNKEKRTAYQKAYWLANKEKIIARESIVDVDTGKTKRQIINRKATLKRNPNAQVRESRLNDDKKLREVLDRL